MRIGFMVPADFSLGNPGNGIAVQARSQAAALERRGHEIVFLNPWRFERIEDLDVVHFFLGGFGTFGVEKFFDAKIKALLVMAPIIDSNEPNWKYRLAVMAGSTMRKIFTVPGVLAQQARASDIVVCRSEYERRRVIDALQVLPSRAILVRNGGDVPSVSTDSMQDVKSRFNLPDKFVLNVSAYTQDRKNILRLVEAVEKLGLPLVLAGHNEPNSIGLRLQEKARGNANLRLLGFVDRATRDALYALCHVFCLPSYHEGTGLAALEAGATAARIVITRNGGPSDYFSDYAQYVDPFNVNAVRSAIALEWEQPRNEKLAQHVRSELSWDASAAALERAYNVGLDRKSSEVRIR